MASQVHKKFNYKDEENNLKKKRSIIVDKFRRMTTDRKRRSTIK